MKREYFDMKKDGFYGAYFRNPKACSKGVILMLGDKIDDLMVTILLKNKPTKKHKVPAQLPVPGALWS